MWEARPGSLIGSLLSRGVQSRQRYYLQDMIQDLNPDYLLSRPRTIIDRFRFGE